MDGRTSRFLLYAVIVGLIGLAVVAGCSKPARISTRPSDGSVPALLNGTCPKEDFSAIRPRTLVPGWKVTPWLCPNALTVPTDVAAGPGGVVYVAEAWDTVSRVEPDGRSTKIRNVLDNPTTPSVEKRSVYSLDVDGAGGLWGYDFSSGTLVHFTTVDKGHFEPTSYRFDALITPFESTLTRGTGKSVLLGVNRPVPKGQDRSEVYRFDLRDRKLTRIGAYRDYVRALATHPVSGVVFIGFSESGISELDLETGALNAWLPNVPEALSNNGMAFGPSGALYFTTGDWSNRGRIYRVDMTQSAPFATPVYKAAHGGFQGLCLTDGKELGSNRETIYAVSRLAGDLHRVSLPVEDYSGDYRLIRGNGTGIHQMLAWSHEPGTGAPVLLINDAESGRILRVDAAKKQVERVAPLATYSYFGCKMDVDSITGDLVFAICAPGLEQQHGVVRMPPVKAATARRLLDAKDWPDLRPASVAMEPDGSMVIANLQKRGQLLRRFPSGRLSLLVDRSRILDLVYPTGLVRHADGSLFVSVVAPNASAYLGVPRPNVLIRLVRDAQGKWGSQRVFDARRIKANAPLRRPAGINDFVVDRNGTVYLGCGSQVFRCPVPYDSGSVIPFADGFNYVLGMALDERGALTVSDGETSSLWRFSSDHPEPEGGQ